MSGGAPPLIRVRWYALIVPQLASLAGVFAGVTAFITWQLFLGRPAEVEYLTRKLLGDFFFNSLLLDSADLVLLALSLWFLLRVTDPGLPARFPALTRKAVLLGLATGIAAMLAAGLFEYLCDRFLHTDIGRDAGRLPVMPHHARELALGIFTAVLVAPLAEEVYFRGLLLGWIRQYTGTWPAVAGSALVFGLLHLRFLTLGTEGWLITGELVGMGVLLGWVAVRTGSLWASFIAHALNNLCALLAVLAAG